MSTIQLNHNEDICDRIDSFLSCISESHIDYHRYKLGGEYDRGSIRYIIRMRSILCDNNCLEDHDLSHIIEDLNIKMS